jgi:hypothetical protein
VIVVLASEQALCWWRNWISVNLSLSEYEVCCVDGNLPPICKLLTTLRLGTGRELCNRPYIFLKAVAAIDLKSFALVYKTKVAAIKISKTFQSKSS